MDEKRVTFTEAFEAICAAISTMAEQDPSLPKVKGPLYDLLCVAVVNGSLPRVNVSITESLFARRASVVRSNLDQYAQAARDQGIAVWEAITALKDEDTRYRNLNDSNARPDHRRVLTHLASYLPVTPQGE